MNVPTKSLEKADKAHDAPSRSRSTVCNSTPPALSPGFTLADMQQTAGNLAIQRMFDSKMIQAKLSISQPGDPYEQEADRVADQVLRMPVSMERGTTLSRSEPQPIHIQRSCAACAVGEPCRKCGVEQIQKKAVHCPLPEAPTGVSSRIAALRGGGQLLPSSIRAFFEPRFNRDFSQVRVHNDRLAAESASAIQARAFTSGQDIVFGQGEFAPETSDGQKLLAHELTHVVQQSGTTATAQDTSIESASKPITPVGAGHIQRDWLDDAKSAVSDTYASTASAVGGAFDTVTSAVSAGTKDIANEVEAVATTVSNAGQAVGPYASSAGKTVSGNPEQMRANLIARVNATRQQLQNVDPDAITADAAQIAALNRNISRLNAALPQSAAAIPLVVPAAGPLVGPAAGVGLGEVLSGIGAALVGAAAAEILIIAIIILAILAILLAIAATVKGEQEREKEKGKGKAKTKEEEEEEEEEEKKKRREKNEKPCLLLSWNPIIRVEKAVGSGGIVGAVVLCPGIPSPPSGLRFDAHHVWPKFAGGPDNQPMMGIFSFAHLSVLHPQILNVFLQQSFGITNQTTNEKNQKFIIRLRTEPEFRLRVSAALTGFYAVLSQATVPPIPPQAYLPGIATSFTSLSFGLP